MRAGACCGRDAVWEQGTLPGRLTVASRVAIAGMAMCAGVAAAPPNAAAQDRAAFLRGQVVDQGSGAAIEGAEIVLDGGRVGGDSLRARAVTGRTGNFRFGELVPAEYALTVTHLAYGTFREQLHLDPGAALALRITLSPTAIALEPLTVEIPAASATSRPSTGSSSRRAVLAAQLATIARSGDHLANALARLLPAVRVRSGRSQPGQLVCVEFRDPASLAAQGCRTPVVIVDNVRQANPLLTLNTLPISHIRSVEAVAPGEAGVRYGADSSYGVIVIETVTGGQPSAPSRPTPAGIYSWALETEPYPWGEALAGAVAANALGLVAGYVAARSCLSFDGLSEHFAGARCGTLRNTGSRLLLYAAPQLGVGYLAGRIGATERSRGVAWKNAVAGTIMATPGIVLALTDEEDGFPGSAGIGFVMAVIGAPVAAVATDRLFRRARR